MRTRSGRLVAIVMLTGVLLYSGLLRLDALFKSYGPYEHPAALAALQPAVRAASRSLTPDWSWRRVDMPYVGGDPINYLRFGREMRSFYAAHVREPGFPAATRLALAATGGADVAVSVASITFSLLTLVATFALGCALGSPIAGLGAAWALGIDRSAVYWSIGGWRDEMFAFFAVLSAWAWLRLDQHASSPRAVVAGLISGAAILTRITSVSLLGTAAMVFLWRGNAVRSRIRHAAIAAVVAASLAGPFLINCWRATGDPFYAINNHTDFYLKREGVPEPPPISALRYSLDKFTYRPITAVDTVATGIFFYPFANKWVGLNVWWDWLGTVLACLTIAGLTGWLWHRDGHMLLLVLLGGLVPFSVTWTVLGGAEWRLTLFAYAFLLLAAFWILDRTARGLAGKRFPSPERVLDVVTVAASLAAILVVWTFAVPFAIAHESLARGEPASVMATTRNRWLMHRGWSPPVTRGNVVERRATKSEMMLPLPGTRPYSLTLRLDPVQTFDRQQLVDVGINGRPLDTLRLTWNPDRVGAYQLSLPVEAIQRGANRLTLQSHRPFRLWYVLIVPQ